MSVSSFDGVGVQERARVAVGLSKVFTGDFNSRW